MEIRNNVQSPNFGMASWFSKKGAKLFVENASGALNKKVLETADKVASTKTYNIEFTTNEIGDTIVPRVVSPYANKYLPPYRANMPHDEFVTVLAKWDGTNLGGDCVPGNSNFPINLKYLNAEEAKAAYNRINSSDFDAAVEIATKLEESHVAKEAERIKNATTKAEDTADAQKIVDKLGIKSSNIEIRDI